MSSTASEPAAEAAAGLGVAEETALVAEVARLAEVRLVEQLRAADAADAKAGMVLGFDAVFAGLFFGARPTSDWAIAVGVGLLLSIGCACGSLWPRNYPTWPDPGRLYDLYGTKRVGDLHRQLIADLGFYQKGIDALLAEKSRWFTAAMLGMTVAVALGIVSLWLHGVGG